MRFRDELANHDRTRDVGDDYGKRVYVPKVTAGNVALKTIDIMRRKRITYAQTYH